MGTRTKVFRLGDTYGGLNNLIAPHLVANNVATKTNNWVLRKTGIETAKGWSTFTSQVLTDGEASPATSSILLFDQFFRNDGNSELVAFTDKRVYRFNEGGNELWTPITLGSIEYTTVAADSAAAQKNLRVESVGGYNLGDTIIVNEDGAREEEGVVDVINTSGTVTPSDDIEYSDDGEDQDDHVQTYTLLKTITITADITGEQRFSWEQRCSKSEDYVNGRIKINGVFFGTEMTTNGTSYEAKTEDITQAWSAGDTLELWVQCGLDKTKAYAKLFRMGYAGATVSFDLLDNLTYEHTLVQADEVTRTSGAAVIDADSGPSEVGEETWVNVSHTDQFTAGEAIIIGAGTGSEEHGIIASVDAGVKLVMEGNLTIDHLAADSFDKRKVYRVAELSSEYDRTDVDSDNTQNNFYFTDGRNPVQIWDSTNEDYHENLTGLSSLDSGATFPDVQGLGTITTSVLAKNIRSFEGFLILGHMVEEGFTYPQKIRWSRLNNYESWVNELDGTGQAGFFTFESSDFITGLHQLKRELLVYRERSIEAMSYIGPPNIFGFRRAETGTGLVSQGALVDFGDRHIFLGPDNVWEYNGISLVAIGDEIRDALYDEIDPSQLGNVKAFYLEERDEVWFSYSSTGDVVHDKAFVYSVMFKKWSGPREVDATGYGYFRKTASVTWDNASGTWDQQSITWNSRTFLSNAPINLMGNDDGLAFELDEIATANGSTISKRYESKLTNLGLPGKKRAQRLRIGMVESGTGTATVYIGRASSVGDSVTWSDPITFNPVNDVDPYVYFDITSEYFMVRLDTDDTMNIRDLEIYYFARTLT